MGLIKIQFLEPNLRPDILHKTRYDMRLHLSRDLGI